mgnify:CR=1 FL=1
MAKKECIMCGGSIGALASRVKCADGLLCGACFKKLGFSSFDGKLLQDVKNKSLMQIKAMSTVDNSVSTKEKIRQLIVSDPGINLRENEICFFYADASVGRQRAKTTSVKSAGVHTGVHVMKGVNLRIGSTKYTPKQETYWEKIPCRFFVTGDRYIALAQKNGFETAADKILDMELHKDGMILYAGNKTHVIFMSKDDVERYKKLWELLHKAHEEGLSTADFITE